MFRKNGYLTIEDIKDRIPGEERLKKGPVAIIECVENIPCNPCKDSCPRKAILFEKSICDTPKLISEVCNGCGICVTSCPGLAIFIVNKYFNDTLASVTFPYEMLPDFEKGTKVRLFNRKGEDVGAGIVERVFKSPKSKTSAITVLTPRDLCMEVRYAVSASAIEKEGKHEK